MKKWTTLLIGATLLSAAVAACGGELATDPTPTPTTTAQVPADWHLIEVPRGEPRFSLTLPPEWQLNELQGIDSIVGEIVGEGVRLGFDFGWYSDPLVDDDDPQHTVTYEDIGGRRAKLVRPSEGVEGSVGVYFEDFENRGEASFSLDLLTIVGMDLPAEQRETAFAIFRSVRDYDSDLTPGPISGVGPGITIGEAFTSNLQGPLLINGHVHAQDGQVRLCELLAESFPPLCGGRSLAVEGLDLTTMAGLTSEGSVTWSDQLVQVLGTVEGEVLNIATPQREPTATPPSDETPTPAPSGTTDAPFNEEDLRALLSDEEIEAAIPLVIQDTQLVDFKAMAGEVDPSQVVGWDSGLIFSFTSAGGMMGLTLTVTDFESMEFVQQHIATVKADAPVEPTNPTIGDESLQGQGGGVLAVMFWKDDKVDPYGAG